ncbi:multidrug/hemolysin transport system permease protein [Oribacterium sinus]|uniref:Multidrug/hemolysin transport system permease protein n=1 Tax=Oribacterium sinus TaxID=237576 RepID=A0A7W9SIJ4_9FIRM|nr:ABC transporter permease [Oribacterium sinus]MBB6042075.1 multidrug/hemolysin transport system permease protein [Oribacterium sinus]
MRGISGLIKRNLLLFFKDWQSILFSLLTSIIVLILYLLFLKGTFVSAIQSAMEQYPGLASMVPQKDIAMFANLFLLSGILGSAMISVPFSCITVLVKDRANKVDYDILATPMKREQIIFAYFVSAVLTSTLLTDIILAVGLIGIRMQGNMYLNISQVVKAFSIVALGSISASAIFMIIVLFFKTVSACEAFFGILSAASGFVIGAYIPISQFSNEVQTVCNLFPASQITIMLRNILLNGLLDHINTSLQGVDQGMFVLSLKEYFTFQAKLFKGYLDMNKMLEYILGVILFCIVAQIMIYSGSYKKN